MLKGTFFIFNYSKYGLYLTMYYYSKIFLLVNLYLILLTLLFLAIFFYLSESSFFKNYSNRVYLEGILKFFLSMQIIVSFFFFLISFFFYVFYFYYFSLLCTNSFFLFLPRNDLVLFFKNSYLVGYFFFFNLSIDLFGYSLLFLAYVVGLMSLFILDTRIFWKNLKFFFSFNFFVLIVYFYVSVSNLFLFFFFYEALLLPSFFFVYFISPSKRSIQASIYFIIWTQIGSIFVLFVFSYFAAVLNVFDFLSLKTICFGKFESFFIYLLLFFGFGFKVPIWPFHYWLTKTHVEAPSGFSIYLSGFLVKSALFGFYKITSNCPLNVDSTVFLIFCFFSVFDSSFKMWGQVDLKKIAAYGTIQEMNLIYMALVLGDVFSLYCAILFVVTHAFLSAFMFFLVDCVYRRFHARSVVLVSGLLSICPKLAVSVLAMLICFSGLPGTVKFTVEFLLFSGLVEYSVFFCFFTLITANIFGLIGFSKSWLNSLFGLKIKKIKYAILDLTAKELVFVLVLVFFLFFFSFISNYFLI